MPKKAFYAFLALLLIGQAHAGNDKTIEIKDAWIRSAPPNVTVMAAYLRLLNHADETLRLNAVSSRQFERVEVHNSVIRDGVAHMNKVEPLILPGKQEVVFAPGGFHLMLINPHKPLLRGDSAHLVFEFSNGEEQMIPIKVRDDAPDSMTMPQDGGHHHNH